MGNDLKMKINHEIKNARKLMNDPILLVTIIFSLIVVSFFVLVPLWSIFVESINVRKKGVFQFSLANYKESFTASGNLEAIINLVVLGTITSLISLVIGFFFAYVSVYIKIQGKRFSTARLKRLRYLKYMILIVFVILLPLLVTNSIGMGDPFFCKYICPQGVLEGAIPLSLGNAATRSALGKLFSFKCFILITVVVLSILFYRPFCKWICPLGAIYSLFNKVSLLNIKVEDSKCIGCGQCSKVCKMDVDVCKHPDHPECIRCGACIKACPKDAIHYRVMGK